MHRSIRSAIAAMTGDEDAGRQFQLAADRIQQALLDVELPPLPGVELGVRAEPSRLVGGDYLDLYEVNGSGVLLLGMGDASGKSLAAALNALMLRYLVRGLARVFGPDDLVSVVEHTNGVVSEDMPDDSFITFVLGTLDLRTGIMRVVNAGHEPPLILRHDRDEVESFASHGIVLGIRPNSTYLQQDCALGPVTSHSSTPTA
jgi:sigma-B regulation protein RsbU (phosphoserine phosphatase)